MYKADGHNVEETGAATGGTAMRWRATLAVALAATLVAAVTPAAAAKITVSQYGRLVATLPWAVALERGMLKAAGVDIDGITAGAGGGTSLRNMLAGELPYAEIATSAAIAGSLAGLELKVLASSSNHIGELTWAAKPDAGINSIRDLAGKKVAYTSPKSITEMVIRTALREEGLTGKVEVLPLGGLGPALTALAQGAVAAAPFNDPALTLTPDKYKVLFYGHQYYPKFTWQVAVTTRQFAQAHADLLRKILQVHRQAVEFVYDRREETARIYAKVWEVSLAEANAILPKYYEWRHWSRGDFSKQGLTAVNDGLVAVGELKEPFDWSRLIDQSLLDEDLRRAL
jgi:NitT/TauT family transport system substrate-binding protein